MRMILHSDLNSFFASVECFYNPAIKDKPVAVCGSSDERHGIVLAANPKAKAFGVKTAEATWQALNKCPKLIIVPPSYDKYVRHSKAAREIYERYTPLIEPFGIDECWLDLSGTKWDIGDGSSVANKIRETIYNELGITVSIGVSFNKTFAKLGSDYKKPDAVTVITKDNYKDIVWPLPASDLLYVGRATTAKLNSVGIYTIGDIATSNPNLLKKRLGVCGIDIWQRANGYEMEPVNESKYSRLEKSIGNSTTTPRDMKTITDILITVSVLSESVAERMRKKNFKCRTVCVSFRGTDLSWFERQVKLPFPCSTSKTIRDNAMNIIKTHWEGQPLRSIGVRCSNLLVDDFPQMSFIPELKEEQHQEELERTIQGIRGRFGNNVIQRGLVGTDKRLSSFNPQQENSPQFVAFMR